MAHVARSIEIPKAAGTLYEEWTRFEELPGAGAEAPVRWRSEVLTFEPRGDATCVILRVQYDPGCADDELAERLERTLERFRSFVLSRGGRGP